MGWNSFPAWTVTSNFPLALEAAARFLQTGELHPDGRWYFEAP